MPRTLTIELFGPPRKTTRKNPLPVPPADTEFTGKDRDAALQALKKALLAASNDELSETRITVDYKETRQILLDEETGRWGIEIDENGVGERRKYRSRTKAIDAFVGMCSENGDHWD